MKQHLSSFTLRWLGIVAGIVLLSGCSRHSSKQLPPDFRADIGPQAFDSSRQVTGDFVTLPLGETGFRATVSAMHYTDKKDTSPDFCFITVEHWNGKQGIACFQRQFPASSVPASVLTAKPGDVISYDPAIGRVTFSLGATNFDYTLPYTP